MAERSCIALRIRDDSGSIAGSSINRTRSRSATMERRNHSFPMTASGWGNRVGTTLKRVPVRGGPAHTIVELPAEEFRGAHWTADGTIVVGGLSRGLWRVSDRGGNVVT